IVYTGGGLTLNGNCIAGNYANNAIEAAVASTPANASGNWWGAEDGPGGSGSGSGDTVSVNVTVSPAVAPLSLSLPITSAIDCNEMFVPQIQASGLVPANGAQNVEIDVVPAITFERSVLAGSGNITLYDTTDTIVEALDVTSSNVTITANTVSLTFSASLSNNTGYYIVVDRRALVDAASGTYHAGLTETTDWAFTVNDLASIVMVPTAPVTLNETGTESATFTLTASTAPSAPVTIPLALGDVNGITGQCEFDGGGTTTSVILDDTNYSNGFTVTVRAVENNIDYETDDCNLFALDPTSDDASYDAITDADVSNVLITINDNDTAGITLSPLANVNLQEIGEESATFTLSLDTEPTAPVTIYLGTSSNECTLDVIGSAQDDRVVLDASNYAAGVSYTVTAVNDTVDDGDLPCNLFNGNAVSADPLYDAFEGPDIPNILITIIDNDPVSITLSPGGSQSNPILLTEAGEQSQTFTLTANSPPSHPVTIPIASSSDQCQITGLPVILDSTNYLTGATFTFQAIDDAIDDGDLDCNVFTLNPTSSDPDYDAVGAADVPNTFVRIIDDDTAGITISPLANFNLTEAGEESVTFTLSLDSEPTASVTIFIGKSSNECTLDVIGSPQDDRVILDATNYATGVSYTITAVDDTVNDGDLPCNLFNGNAVSADPLYDAFEGPDIPNILITIIDND
ncbi:MAG: Ig-like domain-containing protein, partial [Chloroflexota bacterium]